MPTQPAFIAILAQTGGASKDQQMGGGADAPGTPSTASTAQPAGAGANPNSTQQQGSPLGSYMPLILMMVVLFFLMTMFSGRKDKKKREQMMSALGKGDKVITIGGQIGVVDQVRDTEVVLRTDENSNAKARFSKAAIQQILESASGGGPGGSANGTAANVEVKTRNDKALAAK